MSFYVLVDNVYNDEYVTDFVESALYDFPEKKDEYLDLWCLTPSGRNSIDKEYYEPSELWLIKSGRKKNTFDAQIYYQLLLLRDDIFKNLIDLLEKDIEYKKINIINNKKDKLTLNDYYAIRCKNEIDILDNDKSVLKKNKFGDIYEINQFIIDRTKKTFNIFIEKNIFFPPNLIVSQVLKDKLEKLSIKNLKFFPLENLDVNYLNKF